MTIRGDTQIYLMIGHPVAQVKSPAIFNTWFEKSRTNSALVPLDIAPAGLDDFMQSLRHWPNVGGLIATIPYKERVTAYLDEASARVQTLGACNVIRRTSDGRLLGDMTDGQGFLRAWQQQQVSVSGKSLWVIGCGGAGSAVACDALYAGVSAVYLYDIHTNKAQTLADKLRRTFPRHDVQAVVAPPLPKTDIIFNATPLGTRPNDPLPAVLDDWPNTTWVADAATAAALKLTPFLEQAQARGMRIQTGAEMAAAQAPVMAEWLGIHGLSVG